MLPKERTSEQRAACGALWERLRVKGALHFISSFRGRLFLPPSFRSAAAVVYDEGTRERERRKGLGSRAVYCLAATQLAPLAL